MNTKLIKLIVAVSCTATAFGLSFKSHPNLTEVAKKAQNVESGSNTLVISNPEDPKDYGIGTYRVEGILSKNTKVKITLDDKEVKDLTTNSEDGQYDLDVEVKEAGDHVLLVSYKDADGKEVSKKLEFKASDKKTEPAKEEEGDSDNNEAPIVADNHGTSETNEPVEEPKVTHKEPSTLLPDDSDEDTNEESSEDPNSPENRKASGIHDNNLKPKPDAVKAKAHAEAPKSKGKFVLSSHTNFNVVPHGIIKIGGKGNPGDKIMLLVDNKPSMRGTVKSNGRWSFPVKIANPGFRKITAQNLKSREAKTVKLKIK